MAISKSKGGSGKRKTNSSTPPKPYEWKTTVPSTPRSLAEMQSSGSYSWRKPGSVTPQQQGLKGPRQIAQETDKVVPPTSETPTAPGTSGGGSGAAAADPKQEALNRYTRTLQDMLTKGSYTTQYDNLLTSLNRLYGGDDGTGGAKGQINTSMDNLKTFLGAQANPYAGFQAQAASTSPALTEFLQSQGAGTSPLGQYASVVNAQNAGAGTAFQNLANTLGSIYGANQSGQLSDVEQQRTNLANQLEQSRLGYATQVNQKSADKKDELLKLLLSSIAKGGVPNAGELM